jgi:hypothetical protein
VSEERTGAMVIEDVRADASAWGLSPVRELAYLVRISGYHKRLMERAEQAERTPADHAESAEHFGRWFAVTRYLVLLGKAVDAAYSPRASIHREEAA